MATKETTLQISGMTCAACANRIEKGLSKMEGVEQANVNFALERSTVVYDPTKTNVNALKEKVERLGYGIVQEKIEFDVSGMTCAACANRIEKRINKMEGVSEFLPISSTAHIVIVEILMDIEFPGYVLEIFLHLASVLAVIIYFRQDLLEIINGFFAYFKTKTEENRVRFRYALYIIIATVITGVLGILLKDFIDDSIKTPTVISISLAVTGLFLIFIERYHQVGNKDESKMTIVDTIVVALAQTLAVLPGISRSGSTLIAGLWMGLNREAAVRFSFLLAIPVILGSTVLMIDELNMDIIQQTGILPLVVAFVSTFIFSIIGIIWLIDLLKKSKLSYFAIYCFILALFVFFFLQPYTIMDL